MKLELPCIRRVADVGTALCAMLMLVGIAAASIADAAVPQQGYELRPGDIVAVSVWQEPGLEQLVLVRPDGGISFPLAGDLRAEGLTLEELGAVLKQRLSKFIPDPVVTVTLQEIPGNRIYVIGKVNKPGDFAIIARDVTVMQALSMAGGLTPFADEKKIKVLRVENGQQRSIPFDYRRIRRGEDLEQNIPLQAGDVIVVP
ncbi:polysaccharide biosynthesis/export family protein [Thiocapsa bogorovii]|uniref:polysaccharide biosynthesis/export family protein n=1 Tax=Thiocapsa bogorovii TaxID=521689 RepID=UPI001E3F27E8|nr:polysaccharide biosynthesis/export family protein [Thiocapsa bogorovii]UHD17131.1 polysaccharide biosynthesis/export family protein [Thiocapsa bogorovii]